MWLFKEFCSTASSWRWKQTCLSLWALCPGLYFYVLTALMFLGSYSTHPMNAAGSPSCSCDPSPAAVSPHCHQQSSFFRFNTAYATKKGGPERCMSMLEESNGTEWCEPRLKRFIKEGVKRLVENGEMDERRTKRKDEWVETAESLGFCLNNQTLLFMWSKLLLTATGHV